MKNKNIKTPLQDLSDYISSTDGLFWIDNEDVDECEPTFEVNVPFVFTVYGVSYTGRVIERDCTQDEDPDGMSIITLISG